MAHITDAIYVGGDALIIIKSELNYYTLLQDDPAFLLNSSA